MLVHKAPSGANEFKGVLKRNDGMQALLGSGVHPERRASHAVNDPPSGYTKSALSSAGKLCIWCTHFSLFALCHSRTVHIAA